jgi:hypothetical protein
MREGLPFVFFFAKERALLIMIRGVYILSNDLLDTRWNSLSPYNAMTKGAWPSALTHEQHRFAPYPHA